MSKNVLYANEIATANRFVIEHAAEPVLQEFLAQIRDMSWLPHSERWSRCYDFLTKKYPECTGSLATGLSYWLES